MRIADVLRAKGASVATTTVSMTVAHLVAELSRRNIGAMVVLDGDEIIGIASERDVVRGLQSCGAPVLNAPISAIMTPGVVTCVPDKAVEHVAEVMTDKRVRHMPVVVDGHLEGIVSIGDVVKSRISELERDREHLESYISGH